MTRLPAELLLQIIRHADISAQFRLLATARRFHVLLRPHASQIAARTAVERLPALRDRATGARPANARRVRALLGSIEEHVDPTMRALPLVELQLKSTVLPTATSAAVARRIETAIASLPQAQDDGPVDRHRYVPQGHREAFVRYRQALIPVADTPEAWGMRAIDLDHMFRFGAFLATVRPADIATLDEIVDAPDDLVSDIVQRFCRGRNMPAASSDRFAEQVQYMRYLVPLLPQSAPASASAGPAST